MATDNLTAIPPPESEPESFIDLMHRFMSAKYRLRVAVNDLADVTEQHEPAYFVMQEATDDLEKRYHDLDAWDMTHEHTAKAPKAVQS